MKRNTKTLYKLKNILNQPQAWNASTITLKTSKAIADYLEGIFQDSCMDKESKNPYTNAQQYLVMLKITACGAISNKIEAILKKPYPPKQEQIDSLMNELQKHLRSTPVIIPTLSHPKMHSRDEDREEIANLLVKRISDRPQNPQRRLRIRNSIVDLRRALMTHDCFVPLIKRAHMNARVRFFHIILNTPVAETKIPEDYNQVRSIFRELFIHVHTRNLHRRLMSFICPPGFIFSEELASAITQNNRDPQKKMRLDLRTLTHPIEIKKARDRNKARANAGIPCPIL